MSGQRGSSPSTRGGGESEPRDMQKAVAIVQSNYIPWKGYFDLINMVDEFILLDDVQYTRRDWRNRNRILTASGPVWLTIPVEVRGKYLQQIDEVTIADKSWPGRHWQTLLHTYKRAHCFDETLETIEAAYRGATHRYLSEVNQHFLGVICNLLGINTPITRSTDYAHHGTKTERLVSLCKAAGATEYLSGPSARAYMDEGLMRAEGIRLTYMDYSGYPEYPQLFAPFVHQVSVLDLLFNTGTEAARYLKGCHVREELRR
jgi:hypothetical protein